MSRDSDYRRNMGMDMPVPERDYGSERYSVTTKSHVKPPEVAKTPFQQMIDQLRESLGLPPVDWDATDYEGFDLPDGVAITLTDSEGGEI